MVSSSKLMSSQIFFGGGGKINISSSVFWLCSTTSEVRLDAAVGVGISSFNVARSLKFESGGASSAS